MGRIRANLETVRERIARAAARSGRSAEAVRLVAVTKSVGLPEIEALHALGVTDFGENRVETARQKVEALARPAVWHMIGTVQRRKAPQVVRLFDAIDSVDRLALAEELEARCAQAGVTRPVLLEVNVSGEEAKHGFDPDDLGAALAAAARLAHLRVEGLMTMAPLVDDAEAVRPVFARLRDLAGRHRLRELSMGMTNDYEVAIEEGATQVRIGTALFQ